MSSHAAGEGRPKIAFLTPLSPVGSGISYYSEDLLPVLARALQIDLFVDAYTPTHTAALQAAGVTVRQGRSLEKALRDGGYATTIYQLGNSPAHAYMYPWALQQPGIAVLHDTVLHHLRLWMAINGGRAQRRSYADELRDLYGPAGEALAREVLRGKTPTTIFDYPLIEPILERSQAVIVHNAASAARIRELRPATTVHVVPMGVPLPTLPARDQARQRLNLAEDAFVVLSLGHVNPYKRLDVVLRAFRRLVEVCPHARLVIAGSEAPGLGAALARQIGYLGLGERVQRLGFVEPATVADLLAAADCCVNLRYPSAGETSASLLRIMGAGLPVLVSNAGSFRELPTGSVAVVPVGQIEEPLLAEYLIELARNEPLRASLGAAAHDFVASAHSLERAAEGYLTTLGTVIGRPLALPVTTGGEPTPQPAVREDLAQLARLERNQQITSDVSPDGILDDEPIIDAVADALVDLRLAGHQPTVQGVAADLDQLGLGRGQPQLRRRSWRDRWIQVRRR